MYIPNNIKATPDKFLEPLAQAVCNVSRDNVAEYSTGAVLGYVLAKLVSRVAAIKYKKPSLQDLAVLDGALEMAQQELRTRVIRPALEKQRNINGEVWGEIL